MFTKGIYTDKENEYEVFMRQGKDHIEVLLCLYGTVASAYKQQKDGEYAYNSMVAKNAAELVKGGISKCTSKNSTPSPCELGVSTVHDITLKSARYTIQLWEKEVYMFEAYKWDESLEVWYCKDNLAFPEIPYVKLTKAPDKIVTEQGEEEVAVRSIEEIALTKSDVTWLKKKKYYIVNDDEQAEKLFNFLDNYNGMIAYDTETTGLKINCFGKINSEYQRRLEKWNSENPENTHRADKLVGIIYCVEPDVSYYFPCRNRKFKNLYEDKGSPVRNSIIANIKARYTVGEFATLQSDMAEYVRNTPADEFTSDVILMERNRNILTTKHLTTHGGSFEWKVGWMYEIDTNICDDSMIMHQLMYKFRSTTSNKGEPSNLKYLSRVELGIDQWELSDFFPDYSEEESGPRKKGTKKKKSSKIDFSYMDYDGTRIYAPTDGDCTLQLTYRYKNDMIKNHKELLYIYGVELIVECAIGYMEFYGHRINETKIFSTRDLTKAKVALIESEIRQIINYSSEKELELYNQLKGLSDQASKDLENEQLREKLNEVTISLKGVMDNDEVHPLNLASPAQVADIFYNKLQIPHEAGSMSVDKKSLKRILKEKDSEGNPKYPIVHLYSAYKQNDTLLVKFFDNLPYFMYPGGLIFSHFGQISTATGRMSCKGPNSQQYPKSITAVVEPREDCVMLDADYSQIEYRVLVALSKNKKLAELFADPDSDYHTLMASIMYDVPYASVNSKMRSDAKSFNFGIPYGMGIGSLAILLSGENTQRSREEAQEKYELYFKDQPMTKQFFADVKEMAQVRKYTKTFWNRRRYYSFTNPDGTENNARKASALRQAGNAVIQGCLHGDTMIQTKELGTIQIKKAVNRHLQVWDGEGWSNGDVLYSGKKRKCIVTFETGQQFICSPIHKFLVRDWNGKEQFIECKDLKGYETDKNPHRVVFNKKTAKSNVCKNDIFNDEDKLRAEALVYGVTINKQIMFHSNKEKHLRKLQKALAFHGIKANIEPRDDSVSTGLVIKRQNLSKFFEFTLKAPAEKELDIFTEEERKCLVVKSVEITDEYIDMYDVCNTDKGYYVADGIITHNTAADIFKISVARNFMYIRRNKLYGLLMIVNMIHDEQLMEVNVKKLNAQRILRDVGINMQFKIDGFPPLYIGAGFGPAWGKAKGKMAEIHPNLLETFSREADNIPIFRDQSVEVDNSPEATLEYFHERLLKFRKQKIIDYMMNPDNQYKTIHPAIGNLINLQFNYGRGDNAKAYNGGSLTDEQFLLLNIADFIKENNLPLKAEMFSSNTTMTDITKDDEESEYFDGDEDDIEDSTEIPEAFSLVDESKVLYGSSINDIIGIFGTCVLEDRKVCGIDTRNIYYKVRDNIIDYITTKLCDENDAGAMQVVYLTTGNILKNTGIFVKGIDGDYLDELFRGKDNGKRAS